MVFQFFKKKTFLLITFVLFSNFVFGQIEITTPLNRAVYQRGNDHYAVVPIACIFNSKIDKIEVKFSPVNGGTGIDWTTVNGTISSGNFIGSISVREGWYTMEVRGFYGGNQVGNSANLERVGVGEVFLLAGQSNAQGIHGYGGQASQDDRVNCFDNTNEPSFQVGERLIKMSPYSHINSNVNIAPSGQSPWFLGKLGDNLAQKFNIPIMFFNGGEEGTSSENWRISASGSETYNRYTNANYSYLRPYSNIKNTLQFYGSQLGMRAILWMQGETDNVDLVSTNTYYNNIAYVISKSRSDMGNPNLSWIIAKESASDGGDCQNKAGSSSNIIDAQVKLTTISNVYQGPDMDNIQNSKNDLRRDCVHLHDNGLNQVANAWSDIISNELLSQMQPTLAQAIPTNFSITCNNSNKQATLTLADNYSSYNWSKSLNFNNFYSGKVSSSTTSGDYYIRLTDASNRVIQMPKLKVNAEGKALSVSPNGDVNLCDGTTLTLTSSDANTYNWSNSSNSKSITTLSPGQFSISGVDIYGCNTENSPIINVIARPLPATPTIVALGNTTFCSNIGVEIGNSSQSSLTYRWSNSSNSSSIKVHDSNKYTLSLVDGYGCVSPSSNTISTTSLEIPATPVISTQDPLEFCEDRTIKLTSTDVNAVKYLWNDGTTSQSINTNKSFTYNVQTINTNNCLSFISNSLQTISNPLPAAPTITAASDTVFCEGQSVNLTVDNTNSLASTWLGNSISDKSLKTINVTKLGKYTAFVTDSKSCNSKQSNSIYVAVKALPITPTILRTSPYSINATNDTTVTLNRFIWTNKTTNNKDTTRINYYRPQNNDFYSLVTGYQFTTQSEGIKSCYSKPSTLYQFAYNDILNYDDANLSVFPNPAIDQTTLESKDILQNVNLELYTLDGKLLNKSFVSNFNQKYQLDLSNIWTGEFILKVYTQDLKFSVSKKIFRL